MSHHSPANKQHLGSKWFRFFTGRSLSPGGPFDDDDGPSTPPLPLPLLLSLPFPNPLPPPHPFDFLPPPQRRHSEPSGTGDRDRVGTGTGSGPGRDRDGTGTGPGSPESSSPALQPASLPSLTCTAQCQLQKSQGSTPQTDPRTRNTSPTQGREA